jgi:hypothetical protein
MSMVLAACSRGNNSNNNTSSNPPSSASNPGNSGNTGEADSSSGKLTDKDVTYTIALTEAALQPMRLDSPSLQVIYEKTGIKLKLMPIPEKDYATKMNTLMASGQLPDFFDVWGASCLCVGRYWRAGSIRFLHCLGKRLLENCASGAMRQFEAVTVLFNTSLFSVHSFHAAMASPKLLSICSATSSTSLSDSDVKLTTNIYSSNPCSADQLLEA